MRNFLIIRNKWVLLFILTFGCYITDSTATADIESQFAKNKQEIAYIKCILIDMDATMAHLIFTSVPQLLPPLYTNAVAI